MHAKAKQLLVLACCVIFLFCIVVVWVFIAKNKEKQKSAFGVAALPLDANNSNAILSKKCRTAILLTMHASTPAKVQMYQKVLGLWLANTQLHVFSVDSANAPQFQTSIHERWTPCSFDQADISFPFFTRHINSSVYEALSLRFANQVLERDFVNFDVLFKVTGKYFLPKLEHLTASILPGTECLVQSRSRFYVFAPPMQNTEIVGLAPPLLKQFADQFFQDFQGALSANAEAQNVRKNPIWTLENTAAYFAPTKRSFRLPRLEVSRETRFAREAGDVLSFL